MDLLRLAQGISSIGCRLYGRVRAACKLAVNFSHSTCQIYPSPHAQRPVHAILDIFLEREGESPAFSFVHSLLKLNLVNRWSKITVTGSAWATLGKSRKSLSTEPGPPPFDEAGAGRQRATARQPWNAANAATAPPYRISSVVHLLTPVGASTRESRLYATPPLQASSAPLSPRVSSQMRFSTRI